MDNKEEIYLTPEEAAEYLKVYTATIYRYLKLPENPLPSYKVSSKNIRIKKSELMSWVESNFRKPEDTEGGEQ